MKYIEKLNENVSIERDIQNTVVEGTSEFQEYQILETVDFGKIVVLDGDIQSTEIDEGYYHEMLVHPAMLSHSNPETVLIMGGGEGATLREVLKYESVKTVIMVDIDGEFVELCNIHLPTFHSSSFDDKRAEIIYMDINKFLDETELKFDVVIGDLVDLSYDVENEGFKSFYDERFYSKLRLKLNDNFTLGSQAGDLTRFEAHNFIRESLLSVFSKTLSYGNFIPSFYAYWGFVLSYDHDIDYSKMVKENLVKNNLRLNTLTEADLTNMFTIPSYLSKHFK